MHDADTSGNLNGSNQWNMIYLKDSVRNTTVRANQVWENLSVGNYGFCGPGGQGLAPTTDNIVIEYNKISLPGQRSLHMTFEYGAGGGVYVRRNSCAQDIYHFITSNVPSPYQLTRNAAVGGLTNMPGGATQTENISGVGLFDSSMKLTGANRTAYLGIRGAEVA